MRRTPYTASGLKRVPCTRCGKPSGQQWQVCADGNRYRGICTGCDIELNRLVLEFMRLPNTEAVLAAYSDRLKA